MGKIEVAISALQEMQSKRHVAGMALSPEALLIVTVAYLVAMLSVPAPQLAMLIWFALWPIIGSPLLGLDFSRIFVRSLFVLPFAILLGIFNPIYDTAPAMEFAGMTISNGWVTFASIVMRSLLSVQALLMLISSAGFIGMCHAVGRFGLPSVISTQLMMVYRYIEVLLQECLDMSRARKARGYGRRHLDLKTWSTLTGQLFLRTVDRSEAIGRAMKARGFNGRMPHYQPPSSSRGWDTSRILKESAFVVVAVGVFLLLRFVDVSSLLGFTKIQIG